MCQGFHVDDPLVSNIFNLPIHRTQADICRLCSLHCSAELPWRLARPFSVRSCNKLQQYIARRALYRIETISPWGTSCVKVSRNFSNPHSTLDLFVWPTWHSFRIGLSRMQSLGDFCFWQMISFFEHIPKDIDQKNHTQSFAPGIAASCVCSKFASSIFGSRAGHRCKNALRSYASVELSTVSIPLKTWRFRVIHTDAPNLDILKVTVVDLNVFICHKSHRCESYQKFSSDWCNS